MRSNPVERTDLAVKALMDRIQRESPCPGIRQEKERIRQERVARNKLDALPVVEDLRRTGYVCVSIDAFRESGIVYKSAIAVLLKWLPVMGNLDIKECIILVG